MEKLSPRGVRSMRALHTTTGWRGWAGSDRPGEGAARSQERGGGRPLLFQVLFNPALKAGPLGSEERNFPPLDYGMHRNSPNTFAK